jgi:hypothetical protein
MAHYVQIQLRLDTTSAVTARQFKAAAVLSLVYVVVLYSLLGVEASSMR